MIWSLSLLFRLDNSLQMVRDFLHSLNNYYNDKFGQLFSVDQLDIIQINAEIKFTFDLYTVYI